MNEEKNIAAENLKAGDFVTRAADGKVRRASKQAEAAPSLVQRTFEQKFPTHDAPNGWIQWKGTNVCMDVYCVCGNHGHIDADFAYNVKCMACGRVYACDGHIKLVELTPEEAAQEKCIVECVEEDDDDDGEARSTS
jgi:hypothetical protein